MREVVLGMLVMLGACGTDNVDLTGVYRVDVYVGSPTCGADAPITTGTPFLKFRKDNFLGQEYFAIDGCTDAAGTTCPNKGSLFDGLPEPTSNGWRGVLTESSNGGSGSTMCTLLYSERAATLTGTKLVIEARENGQTVDLPNASCVPKEAETRNTSMPCTKHEHTEATKL
jgi:hypothetical protein